MKKDKKYYIDNLTCFVTRVRTINDYEHLRHGLPMNDTDIKSEHGFISVNGCISATETSVRDPSLASSLETQAQASVHADWAQVQAHTNIPLTAEHQSILNDKFSRREFLKLNHKSGNVSGRLPHQPELRMGTGYRNKISNVQDLAVTNWLSQGGRGADSAHFNESSKQCKPILHIVLVLKIPWGPIHSNMALQLPCLGSNKCPSHGKHRLSINMLLTFHQSGVSDILTRNTVFHSST
jgi:hypothetical protein